MIARGLPSDRLFHPCPGSGYSCVMDGGTDSAEEAAIFDAVLAPNRSLGRLGFIAVMAGVTAVSLGLGGYFFSQGAWPVLGFFGLDIALLYLAFRLSYRAGRLRETVCITRDSVVVRRIAPAGNVAEWHFNPYWLRIALTDPEEHHSRIVLSSHGNSLVIGSFLAPEERVTLVRALHAALDEANRVQGSEADEAGRERIGAGTTAGPASRS